MEQWLLDQGQRYGYLVVFFGVGMESMGIPVPGETALLVGAVVAGTGRLNWLLVGLIGWVAAVLGDNSGYWIGRRWGRYLLRLPLVRAIYHPERLAAAERFFARRGWWAVFGGRFLALLRIFAGPLAGMHHMPWRRFVLANASGAAIWVTVVLLVGYAVGNNLDRALQFLTTSGWIGLALTVLLVAGLVALHRVRRRRERRARLP